MVIGRYANKFVKRTSVKQIFDTLPYPTYCVIPIGPMLSRVRTLCDYEGG